MKGKRAILAGVLAVAVAAGAYLWWRGSHHEPITGSENSLPEPNAQPPETAQRNQNRQEARTCFDEAQRRLRQEEAEHPEQTDNIELDLNWLEYLQSIQAEENFPNWSGHPCDLYLQNHFATVAKTVELGLATIEARGNGLDTVRITVMSTPNNPIFNQSLVLPAGTLFTSSSANTQNMIAATSVSFHFYAVAPGTTDDNSLLRNGPDSFIGRARPAAFHPGEQGSLRSVMLHENLPAQSATQEVPSYCINRWRSVPDTDAHFDVSELEATNPLRKLVACLDQNSAKHRAKQMAIWILSDHLMDLTPQELADKFFAEGDAHAVQSASEFADALKKAEPDTPEDKLEEIRNIPAEEFQQERTKYLRAHAEDEVKSYLEVTRPLLEGCGFSVSSSALFR
jgi:hypothetical protein